MHGSWTRLKYQGSKRIIQPEVQRQRLDQLEKERMIEFNRISRNVFLHAMLASTIRVCKINLIIVVFFAMIFKLEREQYLLEFLR